MPMSPTVIRLIVCHQRFQKSKKVGHNTPAARNSTRTALANTHCRVNLKISLLVVQGSIGEVYKKEIHSCKFILAYSEKIKGRLKTDWSQIRSCEIINLDASIDKLSLDSAIWK
jgi:hypothetical protein